jgi:hypothetical protein
VYAGKTTIVGPTGPKAPRLPMPAGFVPWGRIGGPGDYPDPRFCSEIEGLLAFGIYWPLWKLGIPLDFKYPLLDEDTRTPEAATHERRRIRPLIKKARRLAAALEETSDELVEAEKVNPRYRHRWFDAAPDLEFSRVKAFGAVRTIAKYAGQLLDRFPRQRRGPKKKYSKDDLVKRLKALGLSHAKVGEALKLLGLEGAGNARERARQRLRRQNPRPQGTK